MKIQALPFNWARKANYGIGGRVDSQRIQTNSYQSDLKSNMNKYYFYFYRYTPRHRNSRLQCDCIIYPLLHPSLSHSACLPSVSFPISIHILASSHLSLSRTAPSLCLSSNRSSRNRMQLRHKRLHVRFKSVAGYWLAYVVQRILGAVLYIVGMYLFEILGKVSRLQQQKN